MILWKLTLRVGSVSFSGGSIILRAWRVEVRNREVFVRGWLLAEDLNLSWRGRVGGTKQALSISLEGQKEERVVGMLAGVALATKGHLKLEFRWYKIRQ